MLLSGEKLNESNYTELDCLVTGYYHFYLENFDIFETEEECLKYIKKRYEKDFNQENEYSIYHVEENGKKPLIHH